SQREDRRDAAERNHGKDAEEEVGVDRVPFLAIVFPRQRHRVAGAALHHTFALGPPVFLDRGAEEDRAYAAAVACRVDLVGAQPYHLAGSVEAARLLER